MKRKEEDVEGEEGEGEEAEAEGRGRGRQEKYQSYVSPPHNWETSDWRSTCHSIEGITNSAPMDYRQVIQELEDSDLSKDKEMMNTLDDIKQKSLFFGGSDGYDMSDSDLAAMIPDVEMSDKSKSRF